MKPEPAVGSKTKGLTLEKAVSVVDNKQTIALEKIEKDTRLASDRSV